MLFVYSCVSSIQSPHYLNFLNFNITTTKSLEICRHITHLTKKRYCYFCFADELEKAKTEYAKVKEELDATMQELNEMWESQAILTEPSLIFFCFAL